eukprot:CAMPEP_0182437480 /NCGR_PEP_ID=MMETSP1167-20130531/85064_1 /TAXON_ID=2988 /ORGANISM="Mallomonas Sp, Strain CCMP3275" /LENGTH=401 /DNA_ID=CAMNT_0024630419 /DNA_START=1043 /DNA_END=2249 /DNA_ORIENTATION=-
MTVVQTLVRLLTHRHCRVVKPALRTVGNIVCAEDDTDYTQLVLEAGAILLLKNLIHHSSKEIQKEACWTVSNIAAGTISQIQEVIDSEVIPPIIDIARNPDTDTEVKSEACWVVLNATSCGSDTQIEYLVFNGGVAVLVDMLQEPTMVMMALEGLERVMQVGDGIARRTAVPNPFTHLLSTSAVESLESNKSIAVSKKATKLLRDHFSTCAICLHAFSKLDSILAYCTECKCFVCADCDCRVFHLSFQESFWSKVSEEETNSKQAQKQSRRLKKQKQKQRLKEKKAAAAEKKGGGKENEIEKEREGEKERKKERESGSGKEEEEEKEREKKEEDGKTLSLSLSNSSITQSVTGKLDEGNGEKERESARESEREKGHLDRESVYRHKEREKERKKERVREQL